VNIFDLDHQEKVAARLKNNRSSLPLDVFVRRLAERTSAPRLRNFAGHEFTYARFAVHAAFCAACERAEARWFFEMTTEDMKSLLDSLEKAKPHLNAAIKRIAFIRDQQITSPDLDPSPFPDLARALLNIRDFTPILRNEYIGRTQNVGNVRLISFVEGLFEPWRELTGRNPRPDGLFLDFVEAAWDSLAPNQPYVNFQSAIRTAKSKWRDCGPPKVSAPRDNA
jgi:hypothetical protein